MRFENRIAVILGGNSGIGLATAKAFAAEGARVVITGRDERTLETAAQEIGHGARAVQCDMADLAALDAFYDGLKNGEGRIDCLMVNAGVGGFAPVPDVSPEMWDHIMGVNLRGAFFAAQKALPLMGRGGSIVFTGSVGSVLSMVGGSVYAAAKAGLRAVARNMAKELVAEGIRVNVLSPGPTETPLLGRGGHMTQEQMDAVADHLRSVVPMGRMGAPEEIAKAALFLASDDASFITGIDMYVDGGCVEIG
jgi:NAD(P)-dependent dehydrogenase (short-subunit alcohol dehydrogenase family)